MPLEGKSIPEDIREFHSGGTYQRTKKKFGAFKANKQAVAVAFSNNRRNLKDRRKKGIRRSNNR